MSASRSPLSCSLPQCRGASTLLSRVMAAVSFPLKAEGGNSHTLTLLEGVQGSGAGVNVCLLTWCLLGRPRPQPDADLGCLQSPAALTASVGGNAETAPSWRLPSGPAASPPSTCRIPCFLSFDNTGLFWVLGCLSAGSRGRGCPGLGLLGGLYDLRLLEKGGKQNVGT